MSEYADIQIKNLSLYWFRNYLDSKIVSLLFSEVNLIVTENYYEESDEDCNPITKYEYKTTVKKARERLDALGYGLNRFELIFNEYRQEVLDYEPFLSHLNIDYECRDEKSKARFDKYVTFKKMMNSLSKIVNYELDKGNINSFNKNLSARLTTECDRIIYYDLIEDDSESYYAFNLEKCNIGFIFRLILEMCDPNDDIILDFTNLGYWNDDCISKALEATNQIEKTIVLVEGTSDKDILEYAISRIYPHLSDLFYFMDFSDDYGHKREGSTSNIIRCMETFYFSKLKNKFIAIFDNDAEGYSSNIALRKKIKSWPNNFCILCYPEMKEFRKYPTLAPNGEILLDDINRKASSIELYLPDCLLKENGYFYPISWEARKKIEKLDGSNEYLYQGVISNKDTIKRSFHTLRKQIDKGQRTFNIDEWLKMKQLLDEIVFAFCK